jgi:hypothetical protein
MSETPQEHHQIHEGPWRKLNSIHTRQEKLSHEPSGKRAFELNKEYGEGNWETDQTASIDVDEFAVDAFGNRLKHQVDVLVSPDGDIHKEQKDIEAEERLHKGVEELLKSEGSDEGKG